MNIGVIGHSGRLGRRVVDWALANEHAVTYRRDRDGEHVDASPDVVVDVSHHSALEASFELAARHGAYFLVGTSSVHEQLACLMQRERTPPCVVEATNLSFVSFVFRRLCVALGDLLAGAGTNSELLITDRHPTTKADKPSATGARVLRMFEGRAGVASLELLSVRAGAKVSTHEVLVTFGHVETLKLEHHVVDVSGALEGLAIALDWLRSQSGPRGLIDIDTIFEQRAAVIAGCARQRAESRWPTCHPSVSARRPALVRSRV